jgi:hypothetical protein
MKNKLNMKVHCTRKGASLNLHRCAGQSLIIVYP